MTLSNTQSSILAQAALHPSGLAIPPDRLPPGPRASIARALLAAGFVARAEPSDASGNWKLDGEVIWLGITDGGREAVAEVNGDPAPVQEGEPAAANAPLSAENSSGSVVPVDSSSPPPRLKLRDSAAALVARWDVTTERAALIDAVAALRASLGSTARQASPARAPRQGTKQDAVLILLRRPEGATIAHVMEATGWAQHTVRGFFAGLKKKGHTVEVLDRVRQVGPGSAGAKGSYSIYRLGEAG